eukprot:TRINITY_DN22651_c0_g1_i5.p1 TRINITY_DN22651_c0_g1~~TRINITY_DN22651_c0_g1_i5.p1  ORF type:complete len:559 (+),score=104.66 TRINITY_DN22651_c0_g1_i5:30-1706(+)
MFGVHRTWRNVATLLLLFCQKVVISIIDQTLPSVPSISSHDGWLDTTLSVDVCDWVGPVSYRTRCFNGSVPGPTIYLYPGDVVRVLVINNLGEQENEYLEENTFHTPNTTSLHTHGLHVSPSPPGDNVFLKIQPNESLLYVYELPYDHYPGTHLYHTHTHGSASLQVFGGMIGNVIVLPPPDLELPSIVKDVPWDVAMFNHVWMEYSNEDGSAGFKSMLDVIYWTGDQMDFNLRYDPDYDYTSNDFENGYPTVNGAFRPAYTIQVGHWQGLRMTNAGIQFNLELEMQNDSDCEWYILARDGVYLDEPIQESCIFLPPASRMDVVFRCNSVGRTWMWNNASNPTRDWIFETFFGNYMHRMRTVPVLEFLVVPAESDQSSEISPETYFTPKRPSYLESLLDFPEEQLNGSMNILATSVDHPGYNYMYYTSLDDVFYTMWLDKVYQFNFTSTTDIGVHPTHMHLNHVQIVEDSKNDDTQWTASEEYFIHNPAFRVGEWRDTIHVMPGRSVIVRWHTDTFTGKIPMHCHYFVHSDKGMLVILEILKEGEDMEEETGELQSNV